jgi:deazaflavin-dependent oxidoreductase (nitroreductase family)
LPGMPDVGGGTRLLGMSTTQTHAAQPLGDTRSESTKTHILRTLGRLSAGTSRPLAGRRFFGLWAIVQHVGRRSGTAYATPIVALHSPGTFLIPLPFGASTQWPRNVLAAGGCRLRWKGRDHATVDPEIVDWATARPLVGPLLRAVVPVVGIKSFLRLREA